MYTIVHVLLAFMRADLSKTSFHKDLIRTTRKIMFLLVFVSI